MTLHGPLVSFVLLGLKYPLTKDFFPEAAIVQIKLRESSKWKTSESAQFLVRSVLNLALFQREKTGVMEGKKILMPFFPW